MVGRGGSPDANLDAKAKPTASPEDHGERRGRLRESKVMMQREVKKNKHNVADANTKCPESGS